MIRAVEVEIDETGEVHPVDRNLKLPKGRAILTWPDKENLYPAIMSEKSLEDWLSAEEDAAWAHLQKAK